MRFRAKNIAYFSRGLHYFHRSRHCRRRQSPCRPSILETIYAQGQHAEGARARNDLISHDVVSQIMKNALSARQATML